MALQNAIHFIKGSIASSDIVPHMQHVTLSRDSITAENGITKATYHLDTGVDCSVRGDTLVKAIKAAGSDAKLRLTKGGQLRVAASGFSSFLPAQDGSLSPVDISDTDELPPTFIETLSRLLPFVAVDGQQYWAGGVLFSGRDLFATDSKTLVQIRVPWTFENPFVLPYQAIKEMLRIKQMPTRIELDSCADPKYVHFVYGDEAVFTVYPLDGDWPSVKNMLDQSSYKNGAPIDDEFFKHLSKLRPFVGEDGSVYLKNGKWRTSPSVNTGTVVPCTVEHDVTGGLDGIYSFEQLMSLEGAATKINLNEWPGCVPFTGNRLRGIIAGRTQ